MIDREDDLQHFVKADSNEERRRFQAFSVIDMVELFYGKIISYSEMSTFSAITPTIFFNVKIHSNCKSVLNIIPCYGIAPFNYDNV